MTSAQLNTAPTVQWGEREFSIEDSARRAVSAITEMGLTAQLRYYGGDPTVWRCDLFDDGRPVHAGIGFGKGGIGGARVGALYEAVEHHVTQQRGFAAHTVELRCCGQVAQSVLASEPYAGILAAQPDQLIACR